MIKEFFHVTTAANLSSIRKMGLIPKVGKRSKRAKERFPCVYLFRTRADAEDATMNWLGDQFRTTQRLALLSVKVDTDFVVRNQNAEWEWTTTVAIPPESIRVLTANF